MTFFRRRKLPPELVPILREFDAVLVDVEAAKEILVSSVPQARFPGLPLDEALEGFRSGLRGAASRMSGWLVDETDQVWHACDRALGQAVAAAGARLRGINLDDVLGFQAHLELVQELVDLLEPFGDAEERFRELRR